MGVVDFVSRLLSVRLLLKSKLVIRTNFYKETYKSKPLRTYSYVYLVNCKLPKIDLRTENLGFKKGV